AERWRGHGATQVGLLTAPRDFARTWLGAGTPANMDGQDGRPNRGPSQGAGLLQTGTPSIGTRPDTRSPNRCSPPPPGSWQRSLVSGSASSSAMPRPVPQPGA